MEAKVYNKSWWVEETKPDVLCGYYNALLSDSGFKVLSMTPVFFNPQGFTCVWVLAESHLAIHTFPEEKRTYVELSSCVKSYFDKFAHQHNLKLAEL